MSKVKRIIDTQASSSLLKFVKNNKKQLEFLNKLNSKIQPFDLLVVGLDMFVQPCPCFVSDTAMLAFESGIELVAPFIVVAESSRISKAFLTLVASIWIVWDVHALNVRLK